MYLLKRISFRVAMVSAIVLATASFSIDSVGIAQRSKAEGISPAVSLVELHDKITSTTLESEPLIFHKDLSFQDRVDDFLSSIEPPPAPPEPEYVPQPSPVVPPPPKVVHNPPNPPIQPPPISDSSVWDRLAACESGGDWHINSGNGYYGGLQFSATSWRGVGGTGLPHEHSRETQIEMGKRLKNLQTWKAWPGCSRLLGLR